MNNELSNIQMILIGEAKHAINAMKEEGKPYSEIRVAIMDKFDTHWLVTDRTAREQAIGVALYTYGMSDEERELAQQLKDSIGHMIV